MGLRSRAPEETTMPRFGVHAMIWVSGWSHAEAERAITTAARIGYDYLEIPFFEPEGIDVEHTRALLRSNGIEAGVTLVLPEHADISSSDRATVEKGAAILRKALKASVGLGGDYLGGVIATALKKYERGATAKGRANSVAVIRELAREAKKSNVTIGLEAVNRYESNLLTTAAQALNYCDEVGESNVKVHLDTFHMNIEESDGAEAIRLCADRLAYFHVNENHRGYLGSGSIAFHPMFRALCGVGFDGTIAFEAFSTAVTSELRAGGASIWRDLWSDSDGVARHALRFMQEQFSDAKRAVALARD
jgi:D-psicose/D-tagatose/L-ribulose 3-epimerase